jgi:hypothetical protein
VFSIRSKARMQIGFLSSLCPAAGPRRILARGLSKKGRGIVHRQARNVRFQALALRGCSALVFGSHLPANARLSAAESTVPFASPATTAKTMLRWTMLAQADDLGSPPSPAAIVPTQPPPPLVEMSPPPSPGYAWDPGHWSWDGAQYVWRSGTYIVQPTNGATFTPGYWREYPGGWAWTEGRWNWGTQGEGE